MINSVAFCVYPVSDIPRSRRFYEEVLGLKMETNFRDEWIEYDVDGATFAITTMDVNHVAGAKGAVIAFEVEDLDSSVKELKEKQARFVMEPIATSVCRVATIADPDGNEIMIHKRHS